jgi:BirA family transcriptional regulator, biotin operon repressor / biotin---[acetyl-CoA-carboxylase] ligase
MIPFDIRWHSVVSSTMDVALAEVSNGAAEGRTIVAGEQTDGRGRRGRTWASPAGAGLYCSIILRPPADTLNGGLLPLLTLAIGVGVREGLRTATGLSAELKWPNDLLVGRRKLAGILAEGVALGSGGGAVVVGDRHQPAGRPPTRRSWRRWRRRSKRSSGAPPIGR